MAHADPSTPEPGMRCPACGGPTRIRYRGRTSTHAGAEDVRCTSSDLAEYHDIWACPECHLAYQAVPESPRDLVRLYEEVEDPLYLVEEEQRRAQFRDLLEDLHGYAAPGRLLEIGAFAGLFCDEARAAGWDPLGVEPSRWAARRAREAYDVPVIEGTLEDVDPDDGPFDAVCTWDVLEHVPDPLALLRGAHELLAPGGVLGLTTVNIRGWSARLLRGRWPWLMRMHLYYFSPRSLTLMLERAGFSVLALGPQPKRLSVDYILERSERYAGPVGRALRRLARRTGLSSRVVSVQLGDLLVVFARKPGVDPPPRGPAGAHVEGGSSRY